jgi:hypothetical protein
VRPDRLSYDRPPAYDSEEAQRLLREVGHEAICGTCGAPSGQHLGTRSRYPLACPLDYRPGRGHHSGPWSTLQFVAAELQVDDVPI